MDSRDEQDDRNLTWHRRHVQRADREDLLDQRGCVVWLTGFSGSGKSTVAVALEKALVRRGRLAYLLDGDNVRHGLNADLGFSPEERAENIRRVGEVAALMCDAGIVTLTAFISPYRRGRDRAREVVGLGRFLEVFVEAPVEVCEERDPKGLYQKARKGELEQFTGVDAPYEQPDAPDLVLHTGAMTVSECVDAVLELLSERGFIPADE
jgi:adenylylsulfate kinase